MAFKFSHMEKYFQSFIASYDSDEALHEAIDELRTWVLAILDGDCLLSEKALSTKQVFGDICIITYLLATPTNSSIVYRQHAAYDTAKDIVAHLKNKARARRLK